MTFLNKLKESQNPVLDYVQQVEPGLPAEN